MKLSYVIVTHNRCAAVLSTLGRLEAVTPLGAEEWEVWVVDNGSTDGTAEAVRRRFPRVRVIERASNEGVGARSHAFGPARGRYIILLDDDSYPVGDAVGRSMAYLDEHPGTAAVVGRVVLPSGELEACAMPAVMLSGAVCLRKAVLERVGGFRPEFFRKAGEYDLSFRIWEAGYSIERFEDVVYRHDKYAGGRSTSLAHFMDLRNNLILVERYLPRAWRAIYRRDWLERYVALARGQGCGEAVGEAVAEARQWAKRERDEGRQVLSGRALEAVFEWRAQERAVASWAGAHGVGRVVIADYSKNVYATVRAARLAGLEVAAIAEGQGAFAGMSYRGCPILSDEAALGLEPGGVIVSNVNPARVERRVEELGARFAGPILRLWRPRLLGEGVTSLGAEAVR